VRIQPQARVGELGHIGRAHDDRARAAQALHDFGRLRGGCGIGQQPGAAQRGVARDVEQILDRDGQAFQGRACQAGRAQRIAGAGFGQGLLAQHAGEHARAFALRGALQGLLGQLHGAGLALGQALGDLVQAGRD
jgi:hypothetical protein